MLAPSEVAQLYRACAAIGNQVVGVDGFVPLRDLLSRFRAELVSRPLLVEAMIALREEGISEPVNGQSWVVLVDNERYVVDQQSLRGECAGASLEPRLRNTVAHELAHSLAFRQSEFGLTLRQPPGSGESRRQYVRAMEREIERLSPLLLVPPKSISALFEQVNRQVEVEDLVVARNALGVSRDVLIQRLNLLRAYEEDEILQGRALQNVCFGIYERREGVDSDFLGWPLFSNFEKNIVPELVRRIGSHERTPLVVLHQSHGLSLAKRWPSSVELVMAAGTDRNPDVKRVTVRITFEVLGSDKARRGFFSVCALS